jgi:hypothetical protein
VRVMIMHCGVLLLAGGVQNVQNANAAVDHGLNSKLFDIFG